MDVRARMADRTVPLLPGPDREECLRLLEDAVGRVYPLVEGLGVARPLLKLRKMRSQWGNCHWSQGYITLNVALARSTFFTTITAPAFMPGWIHSCRTGGGGGRN